MFFERIVNGEPRVCVPSALIGLCVIVLLVPELVAAVTNSQSEVWRTPLAWYYLLFAATGSTILYLFGQPARADFLHTRFPNWNPSLLKDVCSFVIYVIVGAFVGCLIATPNSERAAFMSGFGWPALLDLGARRASKP
jgi:hypothetical protein